jgi:hypothetical protein
MGGLLSQTCWKPSWQLWPSFFLASIIAESDYLSAYKLGSQVLLSRMSCLILSSSQLLTPFRMLVPHHANLANHANHALFLTCAFKLQTDVTRVCSVVWPVSLCYMQGLVYVSMAKSKFSSYLSWYCPTASVSCLRETAFMIDHLWWARIPCTWSMTLMTCGYLHLSKHEPFLLHLKNNKVPDYL